MVTASTGKNTSGSSSATATSLWIKNSTEQGIRPFTIGQKNFVLIESDHGAKASAIIYSLVETAKANNLSTYK